MNLTDYLKNKISQGKQYIQKYVQPTVSDFENKIETPVKNIVSNIARPTINAYKTNANIIRKVSPTIQRTSNIASNKLGNIVNTYKTNVGSKISSAYDAGQNLQNIANKNKFLGNLNAISKLSNYANPITSPVTQKAIKTTITQPFIRTGSQAINQLLPQKSQITSSTNLGKELLGEQPVGTLSSRYGYNKQGVSDWLKSKGVNPEIANKLGIGAGLAGTMLGVVGDITPIPDTGDLVRIGGKQLSKTALTKVLSKATTKDAVKGILQGANITDDIANKIAKTSDTAKIGTYIDNIASKVKETTKQLPLNIKNTKQLDEYFSAPTESKIKEISPNEVKKIGTDIQTNAQLNKKNFDNIFANWIGKRDVAKTVGVETGAKYTNIPTNKAMDVIKYIEDPTIKVSDEIKGYSATVKKQFDDLYNEAKSAGLDVNYIKNYITHIWDRPVEEVAQIYNTAKKRFGFASGRTLPTYEEGIKLGLKPKYTNPSQIIAKYTESLNKTKANISLLKDLKNSGLLAEGSVGARTPGFSPIIAPGFQKNITKVGKDTTVIGNYYAPTEIANKINRLFSQEDTGTMGKIASITAKVSQKAQDILLSGGLPYTPINAFTVAQAQKEILSGRFKSPLKAFVTSMSKNASINEFKNSVNEIKELQSRNVPITTEFNIENLAKTNDITRTFGEKFGKIWAEAVNNPTFKRFMPMLQLNLYKDIKSSALKAGKGTEEAIDIASNAVKNFYGIVSSDKAVSRSKLSQNLLSTFTFAPKYRESMLNFWGKNIQSIFKNPLSLENKTNATFMVGATATLLAMNELNKRINGVNMWENPEGKKDKLLIPLGNGKTIGIPFLSSIATVPRMIGNTAYDLSQGNFKQAGKDIAGALSISTRPIVDIMSNENYFGQNIYDENDTAQTKISKALNYLGVPTSKDISPLATGAYMHPYIKEGVKYAQGKQGLTETLSKATELPIRWYNTSSIKNAPFWQEYENQKKVADIMDNAKYGKISQEDAEKQIKKLSGGSNVPNGTMIEQNNYVAYKTSSGIKFADTKEEAELEIAKDEFKKSDKNVQIYGDSVLIKDKNGKVSTKDKDEYTTSLLTQKMSNYKNNKDYNNWLQMANLQLSNLQNQYNKATDELSKMQIENKITDLVTNIQKYQSYGGSFTKGKSSSSSKKSTIKNISIKPLSKTVSLSKPKSVSVKKITIPTKTTGVTNATAKFAKLKISGSKRKSGISRRKQRTASSMYS